jgi:hypothetical protein
MAGLSASLAVSLVNIDFYGKRVVFIFFEQSSLCCVQVLLAVPSRFWFLSAIHIALNIQE